MFIHRFSSLLLWSACLGISLVGNLPAAQSPDYAVVISEQTQKDPAWKKVSAALLHKHKALLLTYETNIQDTRETLAHLRPRYACFVVQPQECTRQFVIDVHRLTRQLDDDPYTDVLWGILTGQSAEHALRIANCSEPLVVRKGAGGTAIPLDVLEEGIWFDEGKKNHAVEKPKGGKPQEKSVPDDTTQQLVGTFNDFSPDLFMTSGHATERDWQIGYAYKNGQFRCRDGVLMGVDTKGTKYEIHSPNPKVYLPLGNCLMGHIDGPQAMALAFMGSGGVNQMVGYTVLTWYGYAGWGIRDYFLDQPGRFSLAEAFFCNEQALLHELETRWPDKARANLNDFDLEKNRRLLSDWTVKLGLDRNGQGNQDLLGLLWDRDTLAFYGDPAWQARLTPRDLSWAQHLTEKAGVYTFELTARQDGLAPILSGQHASKGRPPMALFPNRLQKIQLLEGKEFSPLLTENFLLLGETGKLTNGQTIRVIFKAENATPTP